MWKFSVRRMLIMIPQVIALSIVVFILAKFMPGDALSGTVDPNITPDRLMEIRDQLGWNDPWPKQYKDWVVGIVKDGDLGRSYHHKMPVTKIIGQRLVNTFWLSLASIVLIYAIAIPLGVLSGRYHGSWIDQAITGYTYLGFGTPLFIFGLVMLWFFGYHLGWFPTSGSVAPGSVPGNLDYVLSKFKHLLLPSISIALISTVGTVQYLRNEIVDVKQQDFVLTARAKGASERRVYNRHIFRNSLLPIAAFFGYDIVGLIGGTIFIEMIYAYPGMGELFLSSIISRDSALVTALVLLYGIAAIIGTLLSDIILSIVDPRIRIK